ncbi:MAG: hypothetical protein R3B45_13405 [Bdellovibrionota bacterium]
MSNTNFLKEQSKSKGFSAMEVLIAIAFLGLASSLAIKSGLVSLRAREVGRGSINSTAAAQMILNVLKDPTTCASTNIISDGVTIASSVTTAGLYHPYWYGVKLHSFTELRVGDSYAGGFKKGYRLAKINDYAG